MTISEGGPPNGLILDVEDPMYGVCIEGEKLCNSSLKVLNWGIGGVKQYNTIKSRQYP